VKSRLDVFQFKDLSSFVRETSRLIFGWGESRGALKKAARQLGYSSPRTLGMVLNGQRPPSHELLRRFFQIQQLNPLETQFL
jgi:hypothetical protein